MTSTSTTTELMPQPAQTLPFDAQTPWVIRREELQPCTEALANSGLGCDTCDNSCGSSCGG